MYSLILAIFSEFWLIILLFIVVAALYSSVGFGGGSSYLAILALTSIAFIEMRSIALLCNILVVSATIFKFYTQKSIDFNKSIPLILLSLPMSFLGGYLKINQTFFFVLLGFTLLFASITMWISKKMVVDETFSNNNSFTKSLFFGAIIGFLSGMVGIGGGIFLAPLLHLKNWDTPIKIAATSSFFILVNSLAGLSGQILNTEFTINWNLTITLLTAVFVGSQMGIRGSLKYFTPILLKKATAILIAAVSIRILWKNFL